MFWVILSSVFLGVSLSDFFAKNITGPLGMNDTYFICPKKIDRFASSYGPKNKIHESHSKSCFSPKIRIQSGGGGLVSTASDYVKFCMMLLGKGEVDGVRILKEESVREMTTNQLPKGVLHMVYLALDWVFRFRYTIGETTDILENMDGMVRPAHTFGFHQMMI